VDLTRGHFELSREPRRIQILGQEKVARRSTLLVKGRLNIDVFMIRSRVPLPFPRRKIFYTVPPELPSRTTTHHGRPLEEGPKSFP
jgi:hypothetical protein